MVLLTHLKLFLAVSLLLTMLLETSQVFADSSLEKLSIGAGPMVMGMNTETNTIYAAFHNSHQVIAIDGKTNKVITSISLPLYPYDIVVDSSVNKIYVAHRIDNGSQISVIDGATNKLTDSILKTSDSVQLTVDQNSNLIFAKEAHFFGISSDTSIFVINGNTDQLVRTVTIEKSIGPVAFDQEKELLYVLNYNDTSQIAVFDSNLEKKNVFFAGNSPIRIAINQGTHMIYVLNTGIAEELYPAGFVSVIDGITNQLIANVTVGLNPSAISVNPILNRIYVAEFHPQNISIIDGSTNTVMETIQVGGNPDYIFANSATNAVYVSGIHFENIQVFFDSSESGAKDFTVSSEIDSKSYAITGKSKAVEVRSFSINPDESSILVSMVGRGELELELPTTVIEGIYSVKANDSEIHFDEVTRDTNSTSIKINIPENTGSIEIKGTRVIPEFPFILPMLIATLVLTIYLGRYVGITGSKIIPL